MENGSSGANSLWVRYLTLPSGLDTRFSFKTRRLYNSNYLFWETARVGKYESIAHVSTVKMNHRLSVNN